MRALALVLVVACGDHKTHPATPTSPVAHDAAPSPTIGIALEVSPLDANVMIDDVDRGRASKLARAIALEPGLHTLIVTLAGYKPYRAEFTVSDKLESFTVRLESATAPRR